MAKSSVPLTAHASDRQFIVYVAILVVFGLAILTSASGPLGYYSSPAHDSYFFVKRQIVFGWGVRLLIAFNA
jgi:cell division protein FtsW (lipid II flippase)